MLALRAGGGWRVLAGGTDLYPGAGARLAGRVLDVTAVAEMQGITRSDGLRIGGAVTWDAIARADLPVALAGLQMAARQVGAVQVQNAGTIAGNLCNASPAADGVPPLLTLEAEVELASVRGLRRMGLADFLLGPRRTALAEDEVLVAVHIPQAALAGRGHFVKLGARAHLVISIASVAVRVEVEGGVVQSAALAVGACSGVPMRLPGVEAALVGCPVAGMAARVRDLGLSPIDDVRATAAYREEAAAELLRRALEGVA